MKKLNQKISVIINTLNEERNIRNCLECVKWADEIVVVDMMSDDRTVEIAREYTDKIFTHERLGFADPARQFALDQSTGDWVLMVDADEMIPRALRDVLIAAADSDKFDVVMVSFHYYFFGIPASGNGWGPAQAWLPRFFRKGLLTYSGDVHSFHQVDPAARVLKIREPECAIVHTHCVTVEEFIDKFNRYTTIEARQALGSGKTVSTWRMLFSTFKEFVTRYIRRRGYRDGAMGLSMALLMVGYRMMSALKLQILRHYGSEDPVPAILRENQSLAERTISGYRDEAKR